MVSNRGSLIVLRCWTMKRLRRFSVATHNHLISLVGRYNHWIRMGMAPRECVVYILRQQSITFGYNPFPNCTVLYQIPMIIDICNQRLQLINYSNIDHTGSQIPMVANTHKNCHTVGCTLFASRTLANRFPVTLSSNSAQPIRCQLRATVISFQLYHRLSNLPMIEQTVQHSAQLSSASQTRNRFIFSSFVTPKAFCFIKNSML